MCASAIFLPLFFTLLLQIRLLKNNFGFINCCERHEDLIFNFAELADGLTIADMAVGDDVEFTVTGRKPNQSAVR
jgi:hypothetical protein